MAFRDDREALRARIETLEKELARANEELEARAREAGEASADRAELAKLREEKQRAAREIEEKQRADEEKQRAAREDEERKEREREQEAKKRQRASGAQGGRRFSEAVPALVAATPIVIAVVVAASQGECGGCSSLDDDAAPSVGLLDLGGAADPGMIALDTTGVRSAPGGCAGYLPDAPQVVLRTTQPIAVRIAPRARSGDLVAVLQTSDGTILCDDDAGGSLNPLITTTLPAGDSRLWIGTYSETATVTFDLVVLRRRSPSAATTAWTLDGPDGSEVYDGLVETTAAASAFDASCRGYVAEQPQLALRLAREAAVHLHASRGSDLVLVVREADGTVKCDDDSGPGADPQIAALLPAGVHHVWVGTYSSTFDAVPFRLEAAIHAIDRDAPATLGARTLRADGTDVSVSGATAGEVSPAALGAWCGGGLVPATPQLVLETGEAHDVVLALGSSAPFAVIEHPDRTFHCTTAVSERSLWRAGAHRIFVGVPDDAAPGPFTLTAHAEPPSIQPWSP
jgi:hypothetical protein